MFISSVKAETRVLKYRKKMITFQLWVKKIEFFEFCSLNNFFYAFSFFSYQKKKLEFFSTDVLINHLQSEIEESLASEQIRSMMKFMWAVMSYKKETISDKLKNLEAVTA